MIQENPKKLKLLQEMSWDDEENLSGIEDENDLVVEKSKLTAHKQAESALETLGFIEDLDKKFDNLYKEVLGKDDDLHLFSSKVQRFELNSLSALYKEKVQKEEADFDMSDYKKVQKDIQKIFNNETEDILKIFQSTNISSQRKELYEMYDEVADINFIAYRMLRVYLDNIMIKNTETKNFLNVVKNDQNKMLSKIDETKLEHIQKLVELIMVFFNMQGKLKNQILPKTLKYGDYYVEVVNLEPMDEIINRQPKLLTESFTIEEEGKRKTYKDLKLAVFESDYKPREIQETGHEFQEQDMSFSQKLKKFKEKTYSKRRTLEEFDLSFINQSIDEEDEFNIEELLDLDLDVMDNIYLRLLEPSQVLKIEKDGILFGYLIIEDISEDKNGSEEEINIYKRFLSDNENTTTNDKKAEEIADVLTDKVSTKIAELLHQDEKALDELEDNLKISLKVIIYHKLLRKEKLKFRFVDPSNISNFHTIIDKFSPYGTSIFDPIIQPVKMYTIGLMTSIVSRLSRASVVRKWNIEVGNKRNYTEIVERVKRDLKNKSVTYDSLTNIKNIASMITDYKDIATVTKDGQRYIDLEILPMHDRSLPIQELQDLRNELVAATGIPSVYLNIGDAIDMRETLVNLNINFANNIITLQSLVEDAMNDLMNGIFKKILYLNGVDEQTISEFNISQYFKITMNPPLVLQLQSMESLIGSITNILGVLNQAQFQIDPEVLLQKYIPNINWEELKKSGENLTKDEVKKQIISQMSGMDSGGGF